MVVLNWFEELKKITPTDASNCQRPRLPADKMIERLPSSAIVFGVVSNSFASSPVVISDMR